MTRRRRIVGVTAAVSVLTLSVTVFDPLPRLMWNATPSVPVGLYAIRETGRPERGSLFAVAPPQPLARHLAERGYLPLGVPLLKPLAAIPGQHVCRIGAVILIDGVAVGSARERDRLGRPLPRWSGCRVIADDQLFFMNAAAADSLDGRYFGPLPASTVLGRGTPIWTDPPRSPSPPPADAAAPFPTLDRR